MKRKADEMQLSQASRAAKWLGSFYAVSLFIWTLYDVIVNNKLGIQFSILLAGLILFFVSTLVLKNKTK